MKLPSESHPRLVCRLVRGWSAIADDPTTAAADRHAATCPACRAYFAAAADIDERLRRAAPRLVQPLPEGFDRRTERAMAFAARERRTANSSRPSPVMWSTMVGATAVIVAAFFTLRPFESPRTNGTMIADAGEDPAVILDESVQIAKTLNSRFWNSVAPTATTFVRENPLQQEMGAVYADARSALQFLAANFLPESDRAGDASPAVESVPG